MSREVRRVPLDFSWLLNKVWESYLYPEELHPEDCFDCTHGLSPQAQSFYDQWYGKVPFDPSSTGSTPFLPEGEEARRWAERQIERSPEYYGEGELAIQKEAERITGFWNKAWAHHLSEEDVAALIENDRLYDLTHSWTSENGWQRREDGHIPTAAEVNRWSLFGMAHDSTNAFSCVEARAKREGVPYLCSSCGGSSTVESFPGQKGLRDSWEPTEPPTGEGWQLWETVSEGSPVTEVFATPLELAAKIFFYPELLGPSGHSFKDVQAVQEWVENSGFVPSGIFVAN